MRNLTINETSRLALEAARTNRVSVIILHGPAGAGKMAAARFLAEGYVGQGFDHAASLGQIMVLEGKSIGIEGVRQAIGQIAIKHDKPRVFIISGTDSLGHEAQNALLKTLEELPANVFFILSSQQIGKLLPTIRSRATAISIRPVTFEEVKSHYSGHSKEELSRLWQMSGGLAGAIEEMLNGDSSLKNYVDAAKQFLALDTYGRLLFIDKYSKDRQELSTLMAALGKILKALSDNAAARQDKALARLVKARRKLLKLDESLRANTATKLVALSLATDLGV